VSLRRKVVAIALMKKFSKSQAQKEQALLKKQNEAQLRTLSDSIVEMTKLTTSMS
jgi:hypothetical protein